MKLGISLIASREVGQSPGFLLNNLSTNEVNLRENEFDIAFAFRWQILFPSNMRLSLIHI